MKVNDQHHCKIVPFCSLEAGAVFYCDSDYYMKIDVLLPPKDAYAVSLVRGACSIFRSDTPVLPVDGEFVVKKVNA